LKTLTLYFREGCHLCDDMRRELYPFIQQQGFTLDEIDIDRDVSLIEKYNIKVPVLCLGNDEICHHFFDRDMVEQYCF